MFYVTVIDVVEKTSFKVAWPRSNGTNQSTIFIIVLEKRYS